MTTTPSSVQDNNLRGMAVSSISLVTFTIGANLVLLRMYVRTNRHITGWDDYAICVALVNPLSIFTPYEARPYSPDPGTIPFGHSRCRLPSCEWCWQAYGHIDAGTALWIHQVDLCGRR